MSGLTCPLALAEQLSMGLFVFVNYANGTTAHMALCESWWHLAGYASYFFMIFLIYVDCTFSENEIFIDARNALSIIIIWLGGFGALFL